MQKDARACSKEGNYVLGIVLLNTLMITFRAIDVVVGGIVGVVVVVPLYYIERFKDVSDDGVEDYSLVSLSFTEKMRRNGG